MTANADIEARLWAFSLDRYARAGVRDACLDLQDRFGADVNVVLLALWAGAGEVALSGPDFEAITAAGAGAWQRDAVAPLRAARRNIKAFNAVRRDPGVEAMRDQLKRLELEAERQAQRLLAAAFAARFGSGAAVDRTPAAATAVARNNLSNYLERVAPGQTADWVASVETLVSACTG